MTHKIYLGLGSNLGDRRQFLARAIAALPPEVQPIKLSPIYESPPWGFADQGDFLNMTLEAHTALSPRALLTHLKRIENELGRTPTFKNGPREIDIDILLYDDLILEADDLTIPHLGLPARAFVLAPLAAIAPDAQHPPSGQTVAEMLSQVDAEGLQKITDLEIALE